MTILCPQRPQIADVLSVITDTPRETWTNAFVPYDYRSHAELRWRPNDVRVDLVYTDGSQSGWTGQQQIVITDPSEALEILFSRGALPADVLGAPWRCFVTPSLPGHAGPRAIATAPNPPDIRALVAWVSLGYPAIRAAEETALEAAARVTAHDPGMPKQVAWRAVDRKRYIAGARSTGKAWGSALSADTSYPDVRGVLAAMLCDFDESVTDNLWWHPPHGCLAAHEEAMRAPALAILEMGMAIDTITDAYIVIAVPMP